MTVVVPRMRRLPAPRKKGPTGHGPVVIDGVRWETK
jgi:hypothetical protein